MSSRRVLRTYVWLVASLLVMASAGLFLLLFRWNGKQGDPPVARLYVPGPHDSGKPLLVLEETDEDGCYRLKPAPAQGGEEICRPRTRRPDRRPSSARLESGKSLLEVSLRASGAPLIAVVGGRFFEGDWIGSSSDPRQGSHPLPLRGYGAPHRAARVVRCKPEPGSPACIQVEDRLGRLSIVRRKRARDLPNPLRAGEVYSLADGDQLWLGLVRFDVRVTPQALELAIPTGGTPSGDVWRGGDRRWLGRLWPVEPPESLPKGVVRPKVFEVYPLTVKYEPGHLSRRRTNLEAEDVLQRLVDGEWLCLERGKPDRLAWRSLDEPGCTEPRHSAVSDEASRDYRLARSGRLASEVERLVSRTNALLASRAYLEDPSTLPFSWDWTLARLPDRPAAAPQPVPVKLWGIRFGELWSGWSQPSGKDDLHLPEVVLRSSTARHLLQVFDERGELAQTFYLRGARGAGGAVCLGGSLERFLPEDRLSDAAGDHHPLAGVALASGSGGDAWDATASTGCGGCRLEIVPETGGGVLLRSTGSCDALQREGGTGTGSWRLRPGDTVLWSGSPQLKLRYVRREATAWVAVSDPRTRRRVFSSEFYDRAGLAPLLGESGGAAGVEAAVQRMAGETDARDPVELSIDGDLQLAAASVIRREAQRATRDRKGTALGEPEITAVILDAVSGEVLAAVSHPAGRMTGGLVERPTAWDRGSRQAGPGVNLAFLRRRPVGSVMKIAGLYALVNNGVRAGESEGALAIEGGLPGEKPGISISHASVPDPRDPRLHRTCFTGPHGLPVDDQGFTTGLVEERFARSCNGFFILTGFRFAGPSPLAFGGASGARVEAGGGQLILRLQDQPKLAEVLRSGLAADFRTPDRPPRSLYGILHRLGFHPGLAERREVKAWSEACRAPETWSFGRGSTDTVRVDLAHDWLQGGTATPELCPGRDFVYPTIPSPGRMDPDHISFEEYGAANRVPVQRQVRDGSFPDIQYARFLIGQDDLAMSALGLATLFAPAARQDGRAVRPCLFREQCQPGRAGAPVLDTSRTEQMESLNRALKAVMTEGGTAYADLKHLKLWNHWGGKTGTYDVDLPLLDEQQQRLLSTLREFACGVEGAPAPDENLIRALEKSKRWAPLTEDVRRIRNAGPGAAAGARSCEAPDQPLNPAGVQRYRADGRARDLLDKVTDLLSQPSGEDAETYHAFVLAAPPPRGGWPAASAPASGIVIAVLVDDEKASAKQIGGELARAVDRWAETGGRKAKAALEGR